MNQVFNTRPDFRTVIQRQRVAFHRLNKDTTTRTLAERNQYERTLQPVPLAEVSVPELPLVRLRDKGDGIFDGGVRYAVLGEISQMPGKMVLVETTTGRIEVNYSADDLELVPPTELA